MAVTGVLTFDQPPTRRPRPTGGTGGALSAMVLVSVVMAAGPTVYPVASPQLTSIGILGDPGALHSGAGRLPGFVYDGTAKREDAQRANPSSEEVSTMHDHPISDVPVMPLATARAAQVESAISGAAALASGAEAIASDSSGWWFIFAMFIIGTILLFAMAKVLKERQTADRNHG